MTNVVAVLRISFNGCQMCLQLGRIVLISANSTCGCEDWCYLVLIVIAFVDSVWAVVAAIVRISVNR